ncbi:MAG TPA: hypothetical protein VKD28_04730 [Gemmatimonadales bacterium]|nr:hypothetical protein [Gemmatimonadales bacterium]
MLRLLRFTTMPRRRWFQAATVDQRAAMLQFMNDVQVILARPIAFKIAARVVHDLAERTRRRLSAEPHEPERPASPAVTTESSTPRPRTTTPRRLQLPVVPSRNAHDS